MNLSDLASVSEIVGSIAILATLIFLALQIRQNTRAIEASASQDAADAESNALVQMLSYPEVATCLTKDELTDVEVVRLFAYLSLLLRAHEQYWRQYELGVIDEATLARYQGALVAQLSFPSSRNWWAAYQARFDRRFSSRVNSLLRDAPVQTGDVVDRQRRMFRGEPSELEPRAMR
jgi:hypothetical protein